MTFVAGSALESSASDDGEEWSFGTCFVEAAFPGRRLLETTMWFLKEAKKRQLVDVVVVSHEKIDDDQINRTDIVLLN